MLTTTTTSYPVSRSTPLLAALNELNPFTVPKSRKCSSFRCTNVCHFSVERGGGRTQQNEPREKNNGGRRGYGRAGQRASGRQHPVGHQVADRRAAGRQGRTTPTGRCLPPRDVARPTTGRRVAARPAVGLLIADRPAVGRLGSVGLLWADGVLFL